MKSPNLASGSTSVKSKIQRWNYLDLQDLSGTNPLLIFHEIALYERNPNQLTSQKLMVSSDESNNLNI